MLRFELEDPDKLLKIAETFEGLAKGVNLQRPDGHLAFVRAMRHSGARAETAAKQALARQAGLPVRLVGRKVAISRKFSGNDLVFSATGRWLGGEHFGARQCKGYVRMRVWGDWHRYERNFIIKTGNNGKMVFHRPKEGSFKGKLKRTFGPALPNEFVMQRSDKKRNVYASEALAQKFYDHFPKRLEHEVNYLVGKLK